MDLISGFTKISSFSKQVIFSEIYYLVNFFTINFEWVILKLYLKNILFINESFLDLYFSLFINVIITYNKNIYFYKIE